MGEVKRSIITLLTDYGTKEHFVATMKGAALSISPNIELVDISHEITSHDILEGAFILSCYFGYFPPRTIHVGVIDPGVGTRRRPIIVATENYIFIAPDNGLLSYIYEVETVNRVIHITSDHFFRKPVSNTFHGRDIFAPVAAWISKGLELSQFGDEINDFVKLPAPKVSQVNPKLLRGVVLHVDKFGNIVTNFTEKHLPRSEEGQAKFTKFIIANKEITASQKAYEEGNPRECFIILGSSGFYEVAMSRDSAANHLRVARGIEVMAALD